VAGSISHIVEV